MADLALRAERRAVVGKKVRALRRQGLLPANLYGPGVEPTPLQVPTREAELVLRRVTPTTLLGLQVNGEGPRRVLVREVQRHPVTDALVHVEFFAVPMDEAIRAEVPIHLVGEAPAVAERGGTLVRSLDVVEVEALPADLPTRLDVDLSSLVEFHSAIHVRDIPLPRGVTMLTPGESPVVTVVPPRLEAAEEAPEAPAAEAAPRAEAAE